MRIRQRAPTSSWSLNTSLRMATSQLQVTDITAKSRLVWTADPPHELVLYGVDHEAHFEGIIAIHSTARGPALGGTRLWNYPSLEAALFDVLRLSNGMTLKSALAGLPFGGGKSVILAPPPGADRTAMLRAHGRFINCAMGRYIAAEDVGTSVDDMDAIALETEWVAGRSDTTGDPSPFTARGVVRAIEAAALVRLQADSLAGLSVGIQGLGNVGLDVCRRLIVSGARVFAADVDAGRLKAARREFDFEILAPESIHVAPVDIFCPCALGGILNANTIPRLRAAAVAGAANNQLLTATDGLALARRDITYVPDFVANAGGVISGSARVMNWTDDETIRRVDAIFDVALDVLRKAQELIVDPDAAARAMVRRILLPEL